MVSGYGASGNSLSDLESRVYFLLGYFPEKGALTAAITLTTAAVISVSDGTQFNQGDKICLDSEVMLVRSISSNDLTVIRGYENTTAATHLISVIIYNVKQLWSQPEVRLHLCEAINRLWPEIYDFASDTSLATVLSTIEYTIPSAALRSGVSCVDEVYVQDFNGNYQLNRAWSVVNGKLVFQEFPFVTGKTIKIVYRSRITPPTDLTTAIAVDDEIFVAIVKFAAACCLEGITSKRVKYTEYSALLDDRAADVAELSALIKSYRADFELIKKTYMKPAHGYMPRNKIFHQSGKVF